MSLWPFGRRRRKRQLAKDPGVICFICVMHPALHAESEQEMIDLLIQWSTQWVEVFSSAPGWNHTMPPVTRVEKGMFAMVCVSYLDTELAAMDVLDVLKSEACEHEDFRVEVR